MISGQNGDAWVCSMNIRNATISLIAVFVYEILLKAGLLALPSLLTIPAVIGIKTVLLLVSGIIIILFLYNFYREENDIPSIATLVKLLLCCMFLKLLVRLPVIKVMTSIPVNRLAGGVLGLAAAILVFIVLIVYKRHIPSQEKLLAQATVFAAIMSGIGIVKSVSSLVLYVYYAFSGTVIDYVSPLFNGFMVILFVLSHASMIYFLYRYYQFKSGMSR
jgi:hypothetical protein